MIDEKSKLSSAEEGKLEEKIQEQENPKNKESEKGKYIEESGDEEIKEKRDSRINPHKGFFEAFSQPLDIDPGRIMGLTDGIFGMVMTLLIFGMALPEAEIVNDYGFSSFLSSLAPTVGITIISFILIASFWIYHHEFIKIKSLNMPYLWLNIIFLACISFIPFTTSIVGNYSHFFFANVIFGANIFLTILFFLLMFHYAHKRGFLEEYSGEEDKKYVYHTLYIIMAVTVIVNLLDFNVNHNFIYLFLLVPIISTIRDIQYRIKH